MNHYDRFTKALIILDLLDEHRLKGLTASQIIKKTDISRAEVYRILRGLVAIKWVYTRKGKVGRSGHREPDIYRPRIRLTMVGEE